MSSTKLIDDYSRQYQLFDRFREDTCKLLSRLLEEKAIHCTIESRTKSPGSLEGKVSREGKSYESLCEVTDLVGLRVIVQNITDVDKVSSLIQKEFSIDADNSHDIPAQLEANTFGYLSIHFVASISNTRIKNSEWKAYEKLVCEIQVRTALQHAWANISHHTDYKTEQDIPAKLRRRLIRLSALFELADDEFDAIVKQSFDLRREYSHGIEQGVAVELNKESLRMFIQDSPLIKQWDEFVSDRVKVTAFSSQGITRDVAICNDMGLKTIQDLEGILLKFEKPEKGYVIDFIENTFGGISKPNKMHSISGGFIVILSLVASFQDELTEDVLIKKYWFSNPKRILQGLSNLTR